MGQANAFPQNRGNEPMRALWRALKDEASTGIEVPMAIIMDPRCGIERATVEDEITDEDFDGSAESTPLLLAIHAGRNDVVEALLVAGADHSAGDCDGSTPLMVAAGKGNVDVIQLLVIHGASLSLVDSNQMPALHYAAWWGQLDSAEALLRLGADLEAVDIEGKTALYRAADFHLARSLLRHGANISVQDKDGFTPLHTAAETEDVEGLLDLGADIEALDKRGQTPLHHAIECESPVAIKVLLYQGARPAVILPEKHDNKPQQPQRRCCVS